MLSAGISSQTLALRFRLFLMSFSDYTHLMRSELFFVLVEEGHVKVVLRSQDFLTKQQKRYWWGGETCEDRDILYPFLPEFLRPTSARCRSN